MRKLIVVLCITAITQGAPAAGLNSLILEQIQKMPTGGKYSVSHVAKIKLESAAHFESGKFFVIPTAPYPSFCSGATYIVFIKTIEALRDSGQLKLDFATLNQLMIRDQRDGEASRRRICPFLVEQYSGRLRRKRSSAKQDRLRNLLPARNACESNPDPRRSGCRCLSRLTSAQEIELRRSQPEVRDLVDRLR